MGNDKNVTIPLEVHFDLYQGPNNDLARDPPLFEMKLIPESAPQDKLKTVWKLFLGSRLST